MIFVAENGDHYRITGYNEFVKGFQKRYYFQLQMMSSFTPDNQYLFHGAVLRGTIKDELGMDVGHNCTLEVQRTHSKFNIIPVEVLSLRCINLTYVNYFKNMCSEGHGWGDSTKSTQKIKNILKEVLEECF